MDKQDRQDEFNSDRRSFYLPMFVSLVVKRVLSRVRNILPKRLEKFFFGGAELEFHSCLSSTELANKISKSLNSRRSVFQAGVIVRASVSSIEARCASSMYHNGLSPVFHGQIVDTATGSVLRGRISASRPAQFFVAVWGTLIIVFSLLFVWTIIFPLFGCLLLCFGYGVLRLGDWLRPNDERDIQAFLQDVCEKLDSL